MIKIKIFWQFKKKKSFVDDRYFFFESQTKQNKIENLGLPRLVTAQKLI